MRIEKIVSPGQDYLLPRDIKVDDKTVLWLLTAVSASHSPATEKILKKNKKLFLISNPGLTPDWLPILNPANQKICRARAEKILTAIGGDVGGWVYACDKNGSDLIMAVPKGNWWSEIGTREGIGTNGPFGELCTAPYRAGGKLILNPGDYLTNPINRLTEQVVLTIDCNRVEKIEGGKQAAQLAKILGAAKDNRAFELGEFSIQLNPAQPDQVYRSVIAEKLAGGFHIALGTNSLCLKETCPDLGKFQYGRYNAGVHIDCIHFGASVSFEPENEKNGKAVHIIRKGKLIQE
ncbi:MAG TPA: hypothetical protein VMC41_04305 [Candidatus Nanoarchaeia archaeon]|nr:hypothetical protein [Candidatus Nanoarchaeia archaeon]